MRLLEWFHREKAWGSKVTKRQIAEALDLSEGGLARIMDGGGCQAQTALKIIDLTKGAVTLEDLVQGPDGGA